MTSGKYAGFLQNHSLAYVFLLNRIRQLPWNATRPDDPGPGAAKRVAVENATLIYRTNLENFIAIARSRGMKVVLVTMALNFDPAASAEEHRARAGRLYAQHDDHIAIARKVAVYNRIQRELADGETVFVIDVEATGFGLHKEYFWDLCHFNETGAAAFAELVQRGLRPLMPP